MNRLDFYLVSAQVIPVLFLALAFETRAFGRLDEVPEKDLFLASIRFYAFLLIVWGEARALGALSSQHPSAQAHDAIVGALVTAAVLLGVEPAVALLRSGSAAIPPRYERQREIALSLLLILVGFALAIVGVVLIIRGI